MGEGKLRITDLFQRYNKSGDGFITRHEFTEALRLGGADFTPQEVTVRCRQITDFACRQLTHACRQYWCCNE